MEDDSATLQHLIQDLRSQLTRCHKVIRGLQLRVRSLSATSDYASSLERTPRKVTDAFPSGIQYVPVFSTNRTVQVFHLMSTC